MRTLAAALFAVFALAIVTPPTAWTAEPGPASKAAIQRVIQSQLDAFQRDDGVEAYSYAAPGIQRMFQTPDIFMEMVKSGYQPVYRPKEFEFRELRAAPGQLLQQEVLFVGPDGQPVMAVYTMEQQPNGSWRIAGVVFIAAPDRMT